MALSIEQFGKELLSVGLAKSDELKRLWSGLLPSERPRTSEAFAQLLVRREMLTEFQATQILAGRAASLVVGDCVLVEPLDDVAEPAKFRARNRGSGRPYVVERLPAVGSDAKVAERAAQRVRGVVKLVHPNLARVFEVSVVRGQPYLTREWIEGRSLFAIIGEQGPLVPIEAVDYLAKAGRGLAELHTARIAHGNLKPTKIVVDAEGDVKLLGVDVRSPAAQAAAASGEFDPTDDLAAFGRLTFFLLTGEGAPGGATGTTARPARELQLTSDSLKAKRPNVPAEIDRVFRKLIDPSETNRYENAAEVVADLDDWRFPKTIAEPAADDPRASAESVLLKEMVAPVPEGPPPLVDRNNKLLLAGAAINLTILGVLYLIFWRTDEAAEPPSDPESKFNTLDVLAAAHASGTAGGAKGTAAAAPPPIVDTRPKSRVLSTAEEKLLASGPQRIVVPFDAAAARAAQQAWADHLGEPIETTNPLGLKLTLIPPGEATVGTPPDERKEWLLSGRLPAWVALQEPQYPVVLTRPFRLSTTEITLGQYRKFVEATGYKTAAEKVAGNHFRSPGYAASDDQPVTCIGWNDAQAFCDWLNTQETGLEANGDIAGSPRPGRYRLPTEAEWEFACRAGSESPFSCGDESKLLDFGWTKENSFAHAQPTARKKPNAFGLFDLHGNATEWCLDWYADDPKPSDPHDPRGPISGGKRIVRGGSWDQMRLLARSAFREGVAPSEPGTNRHGFRVVREW